MYTVHEYTFLGTNAPISIEKNNNLICSINPVVISFSQKKNVLYVGIKITPI